MFLFTHNKCAITFLNSQIKKIVWPHHNAESTSTSYLFELLQVFIQLQIIQDDGNEKTEQDLKCNTRARMKLCAG